MTCDAIETELVAYHFGLLEGAAREKVEAHLLGCTSCVGAFVELKRAIETGDALGHVKKPSRAARNRLRQAVAREVAPSAARKWWERPIAFAVAASIVLAASATTRAITSGPGAPPYAVGKTAP